MDRDNPYFGNRFRVEFTAITNEPIYVHLTNGSQIKFDLSQVSEKQPAGNAKRDKNNNKNNTNNYDFSIA
ncbi:MAG TPA: hypothetical protein VFO76_00810 [Candidatus Kapabacteria bacterium]|nr:hypothetical protein [Candidatus Kapabacteria bacterium]